MMRIAAALCLLALPALAQAPCKSYYPVGEVVPAGCVQSYNRWGTGAVVAPTPGNPPVTSTIEDAARAVGLGRLPSQLGQRRIGQ
jgi:hypothetical protein